MDNEEEVTQEEAEGLGVQATRVITAAMNDLNPLSVSAIVTSTAGPRAYVYHVGSKIENDLTLRRNITTFRNYSTVTCQNHDVGDVYRRAHVGRMRHATEERNRGASARD